jgi:hypothetical protein
MVSSGVLNAEIAENAKGKRRERQSGCVLTVLHEYTRPVAALALLARLLCLLWFSAFRLF